MGLDSFSAHHAITGRRSQTTNYAAGYIRVPVSILGNRKLQPDV